MTNEKSVEIPIEPSDAILYFMAITYDHALGCPGYYDHEMFAGPSHEYRLKIAKQLMRKLYNDIVILNSNPELQKLYQPEKHYVQ